MSVLEAAAQNYMADVSFSSSARVPRESTPHIVPDEGSVLEAADLITRPRAECSVSCCASVSAV